jgi:Asp-tRNA(Asn)/Glu-tRNA(Gln) amidotransferase A subunit family amidase
MVPGALGTQTAGSLIRPASFCGVYAFKPTFGFIPRTGVLPQAKSLDTLGVFGRSIEDLALLTDMLQLYDERDPASISQSRPRLFNIATMEWPLKPAFAFVKTHAWHAADASLREAFSELAGALEDQVTEIALDSVTEAGTASARIVQKVELAAELGPVLDKCPDLVSQRLADEIEEGRRVSAVDYRAALEARDRFYASLESLFLDYGMILTPAALGPAPKGLETTGDPVFNLFWTYLGAPAVSLPLLEAEGLPIGVQLVGARRDDGRLLRGARLLVKQLTAEA